MPSFVGGDVDGGNSQSLTSITWPGGLQSGDTAILFWTSVNSVLPTPDPPTGFTTIDAYDANSGSQRNRLLYKICTGSETGNINFTTDDPTTNRQSAVLWIGRGFHAVDPIDGFARFDETAAGTTHDPPSYTLVDADCGVLTLIAERATTGTNDYTPPTGFTSNHLDTTTLAVGTGGTITAVASDDLNTARAASTAVNPGVWTSANSFSTANAVAYTLALAPAAPNTVDTFVRPVQSPLQIIR